MADEHLSIVLNGEPATVPSGTSLTGLIQILGLNPGQVAIEVNRQIIKREHWNHSDLKPGDQVEVVHFVGGG